ncbi:MAG: methyltransferase domain-containing protein [Lachnospiraceae bacterium]|uniref:Methyltransferase n=1 Tax=Candidatus Weimeria bifida TaxID=2599074 RepID=A0A6N7IZ76_9FIRM|nr:methyltransferase [Candidatus Weimeria bifida]RRF97095.1 MAG: methyltransferase domain-containing protein [Lachnospiraceae bacterium]
MENLKTQLDNLKNNTDLRQTLSTIRKTLKEDAGVKKTILNDREALEAILGCLKADDAKSRKSAALLLGELSLASDDAARAALIDAYRSETTLFVRESYLKALAVGGGKEKLSEDEIEALRERLREIDSGRFEESDMKHILAERKAIAALLPNQSRKRALFSVPKDSMVLMVPQRRFYETLKKALNERGIEKGFSPLGVLLYPNDIAGVRDLRIYDHLEYIIPGAFTLEPEKTGQEIRHSAIASFLEKVYNGNVSVRVRIHETGDRAEKQVKRFTGELLRSSGGKFLNEPPYDTELHFYRKKSGGYMLFMRPLDADQRFVYCRNRLSTSMQPVKAALMAYMLDDCLSSYARVCDLFAGNGTLLLERDELLRTKVMFALDTNADAIEAGRENASLKGRKVNFVHRSAFTFETEEPFDEIISELPDLFEKEESDRQEFFEKLAKESVKILRDGGKAFYLTSEGNEIKAMARRSKNIEFIDEMPFDERRSIFILKVEK